MPGRSVFETIVVGVDGDEGGREARVLAARLRRTFGSRVIAVASRSSPRRALHDAAEHHGADLIVVGTRRRRWLERLLGRDATGSTLRGAPCPVAVAPHGLTETARRLRTIAVGFDGSPESRAALDLARDVAQVAGARLQLLWVVPPPVPVDPWASAVERTERDRAARRHAQALVAETVAALGDDADGDTAPGLAHVELAQLSQEVDLLVVGSRGHGVLRRVLHGSTSTRLVRAAACPVLVVPHDFERRIPATAEASTVLRKAA
jgi:nucleotide-binding universal stress UspA family protein